MMTQSTHRYPSWLVGGSEMAHRMRAMEWSKTLLGRVEGWSSHLRSTLSLCINSSFPMALYWGPESVLLYNDGYCPILGDRHPGALGLPAREGWFEDWEMLAPLVERGLAKGVSTRRKDLLLFMHRHGYVEECYFDFSLDPVYVEDGAVGGVIKVVVETTYRVIGERRTRFLRELVKHVAAAQSAEEVCELAAEAFSDARSDIPFALLYLVDRDGKRARLAGTTGVARDPASNLQVASLAEGDAGTWPLGAVVRTRTPMLVSDARDRFEWSNGSALPEPVRDALVLPIAATGLGTLAGFLVVGISPRRKLDDDYRHFFELAVEHLATAVANATAYETQRRRAEVLAEVDRAKTLFFSNVSHEFRTPLTLILGPLGELLSSAHELPAALRDPLALVQRNAVRLMKLVNTLLDFSRIEAGRANVDYEPTDLATFTRELAGSFDSAMEKAGLGFHLTCSPLQEPVFVDRGMWEKIVLNLVSNAFKFTLEGEIEVSIRAAGTHCELRVRDTGVGIPEAELPHIFERFHRVEGTHGRTLEGTGIGLALVQELVKLHGGTVRVESALGHGSTFTVTIPFGTAHLPPDRISLPRARESTGPGADAYVAQALGWLPTEAAPSATSALGSFEAAAASNGERKHESELPLLLLADDSADMREYVRHLLAPHYVVQAVPDGQVALDFARRTRPALVLTDVMMPRLDGFALLRELRSDARLSTVPVILLSARAGDESRAEGLEAGADDYLVKPFGARELLACVRANIELASLRADVECARGRVEALRDEGRRKDEFLLALSHELRTPITPLKLQLHLLREMLGRQVLPGLSEDRNRLLQLFERSERQVEGLADLVEDLLELCKVSTATLGLDREDFDLVELTRMAVGRHSSRTKCPIELRADKPVRGRWDRRRIEQVVGNLLTNATTYGEGKPITVTVGEALHGADRRALLSVQDRGIGIAAHDQRRIFERFERAVSSRHFGGLGLGLHVCRRIADAHDGTLRVESEQGAGSTFIMELPLRAESACAVSSSPRPRADVDHGLGSFDSDSHAIDVGPPRHAASQ